MRCFLLQGIPKRIQSGKQDPSLFWIVPYGVEIPVPLSRHWENLPLLSDLADKLMKFV